MKESIQTKSFTLPYYTVKNISSPEDTSNNRRVYIGQTTIDSIVTIPANENVRDYLLDAEGKIRRVPTQVHRAILDTLQNNPDNFSILNSGIVIVARNCEIMEKDKILVLTKPSIINGSQTQGVIKDFLNSEENGNAYNFVPHIKFEIVVTDNEGLIAETSISRNFQNDVMSISIVGRLGQLDELEEALQSKDPTLKLKKSETKLSEDYVKTERLLQIIAALVPEELWLKSNEMNKVYTYSMKAKCLKDFQEIHKKAKESSSDNHQAYKDLYKFYLDIAKQGLDLYDKWKSHQGFKGTWLRSIQREDGRIKDVPDGIVFPILASLSAFAKKTKDGWRISPPPFFSESELIKATKSVYMEIAHSNPWNMGKSKACYSALYQITSIYKKLDDLQNRK